MLFAAPPAPATATAVAPASTLAFGKTCVRSSGTAQVEDDAQVGGVTSQASLDSTAH
jgi:hypothetical protein